MSERVSESVTETTTVAVTVPATPEQLTMLRALAETVLLIADFGLDEVTDIRLALDEIATVLLQDAVPESTISCAFTYREGVLKAVIQAVGRSETEVGAGSFGWHIVQTLTDSVTATRAPFDAAVDGYPTVVEFVWARGELDEQ
ncbi:anti-sigma factor [Nocardia brasiliensis]|uniref:Anti-sigma factor n=1 Tax=Nocardia brasiliensis (strain ATCC 700358 / HUJEG-1) TaxID=1133849 RepID=K0F4H1_NOCB7|nr:anti-sigma factor [Nocardia brasiliensis]AFU04494.1 anti-sigma factor [Nocardia brasiliensis ATCC 700358]OCF85728.1 anti-sigma factor [Nocardia brasiliensis]